MLQVYAPSDLMNDVASVIRVKWKLVGVQLELSSGTLDSIQAQKLEDQMAVSFI